jgi:uncharacterized protein YukE
MTPPASAVTALDPAAVLPVAAELPAVARKLAQLIEEAVAQRARLTAELLPDWYGASRASFDDGEIGHGRRATELVAALRRLANDVVDAGTIALRDQQAAEGAPPAPGPSAPAASGGRRPQRSRPPAVAVAPLPPPPTVTARPSGDADHDGHRDPGWEPGNLRDDAPI